MDVTTDCDSRYPAILGSAASGSSSCRRTIRLPTLRIPGGSTTTEPSCTPFHRLGSIMAAETNCPRASMFSILLCSMWRPPARNPQGEPRRIQEQVGDREPRRESEQEAADHHNDKEPRNHGSKVLPVHYPERH